MKYLLLLGVVLGVLWLLRQARSRKQVRPPASTQPPPVATEIVACARCGVHLPRAEALEGARGLHYCSPVHQREAEGG